MIYLFTVTGFGCGFLFGLGLLKRLLRGYSKEELLTNKSLHWKYGLLVWFFSVAGAALFFVTAERYFLNG